MWHYLGYSMKQRTMRERVLLEHNKLIDLRDKYGLTDQGHALLHQDRYFLTGRLVHSSKCRKVFA